MGKADQTTTKRVKSQHVFMGIGVFYCEVLAMPTNKETIEMVHTD